MPEAGRAEAHDNRRSPAQSFPASGALKARGNIRKAAAVSGSRMKRPDAGDIIDGDSLQFYPPIAQLAAVGDRRTAAVIGADGMVRWLCLPDYDGIPVFGCLLNSTRGGHWRLGPATGGVGRQSYIDSNNVLVTCWQSADAELELTDAMLAPEERRPAGHEGRRTLLRRLRCRRGSALCAIELIPRDGFAPGLVTSPVPGGLELRIAGQTLALWTSRPVEPNNGSVCATFSLTAGDEFWAALGVGSDPAAWNAAAADEALQATIRYWREWNGRYRYRRSAQRSGHPIRAGHRAAFFRSDRGAGRCADQLASRTDRRRPQL